MFFGLVFLGGLGKVNLASSRFTLGEMKGRRPASAADLVLRPAIREAISRPHGARRRQQPRAASCAVYARFFATKRRYLAALSRKTGRLRAARAYTHKRVMRHDVKLARAAGGSNQRPPV